MDTGIAGDEDVDVFVGVDVGKGEHHAVAIDRAGKSRLPASSQTLCASSTGQRGDPVSSPGPLDHNMFGRVAHHWKADSGSSCGWSWVPKTPSSRIAVVGFTMSLRLM